MKKNTLIIITGLILIVIIGLIILIKPASKNPNPTPTLSGENTPTKGEIPKDVKVYNAGESAPEGTAVPDSVSDYGLTKLRSFTMKIEDGVFTPQTFICYEGEMMKIWITAIDKDYDVVQPDNGLKLIIKKGETKFIESQMNDIGKFTFYCESCGGLNSKAVGYMIVVPKPVKKSQ
ncbi:MAG: hypothetical protein N2692_01530 [Patescibacteria group bacterium]|jgi:hypothetical protein|nr:hypothetical protein [Patescibacteria group bacterium]